MAYKIENERIWTSYTIYRRGRFRFFHFDEFLEKGIQFFPYGTIPEISRAWNITKKLLKTRSRPKAQSGNCNGVEGIYVFRLPRIYGEEYLTKTLDAMRFTSEKPTYL